MKTILLNKISLKIDIEELLKSLHIKKGSKFAHDICNLVSFAVKIARPKAAYRLSPVECTKDGFILIEGIKMESKIMYMNMNKSQRAFPYIATCGIELEKWSGAIKNFQQKFWAENIKMIALGAAIKAFGQDLAGRFQPGLTSSMNPGSLDDWPLQEQHKIFKILGNACDLSGVRLTKNAVMIPSKSVSGIQFPSKEQYYNCQLCPREKCPMRKVPYDKEITKTKFPRPQ
jgi:hypothetical protein